MLFDTTFVIHLEREFQKKQSGPAQSFLLENSESSLNISIITLEEFAEGYLPEQKDLCWYALSRYTVLHLDHDIAWQAAQISRQLRDSGQNIGDNDIWIAATALHHKLPLVTRNTQHFQRIPRLHLVLY